MHAIVKVVAFYLTWILLHYGASHLYTQFCTPWSIYGFLFSPFVSSAPHCMALRWFMFTGTDNIQVMWIAVGALGAKYLSAP